MCAVIRASLGKIILMGIAQFGEGVGAVVKVLDSKFKGCEFKSG